MCFHIQPHRLRLCHSLSSSSSSPSRCYLPDLSFKKKTTEGQFEKRRLAPATKRNSRELLKQLATHSTPSEPYSAHRMPFLAHGIAAVQALNPKY